MKISWKMLCVCACLVIGFSVVLPYFSVSGFGITLSKSLMDGGDGIYVLIIAAVALVLSLTGKFGPVVFLGIASFAVFFLEKNSVTTNMGKEVDALAKSMLQKGLGYYGLLVGSIALIVFAVLGLMNHGSMKHST